MHEASLIQALLEQVQDLARREGARRILRIQLRVGRFSTAVPELLESAFEILKQGTPAEEARLDLHLEPARVRCEACGLEYEPEDLPFICPRCGTWGGTLLQGRDLVIEAVDLEV